MKSRHELRKHINKKLRTRLRLYFFISLILIGVVVYEIATQRVSILFALLSILIGIGIGIMTARMFHISWSHDARKIVSRLDIFGGVILVFYILFAIFRSQIIGHFVQGSMVGGISISVVTGVMIGRVLGTRGRILQVLKEQNVF